MELEIDWNRLPVNQIEQILQVFGVSFPKGVSQFPCPFPGYLGSSRTWNSLRDHFNRYHWVYSLRILE